jgi:hypothetical protein
LKEAEKLRVGVRQGMMWFGRERLADGEYEAALADMRKTPPDNNGAMWHLDCAINLNPTFIEAIDLKEKLSGKTVTAADNSTIRSFVQRQIMLDPPAPSMPRSEPTTNTSGQPVGPLMPVRASITTQPADENIATVTTQPVAPPQASIATQPAAPTQASASTESPGTVTANTPVSLEGATREVSSPAAPADSVADASDATPSTKPSFVNATSQPVDVTEKLAAAPAATMPSNVSVIELPDDDGTPLASSPATQPNADSSGTAQIDTSVLPGGSK